MKKRITVLYIALLVAVSALLVQIRVPVKTNTVSEATVTPSSSMVAISAPSTDGPYDVEEAPVYTEGGKRVYYLRETGMVVTEDGTPVADPNNSRIVVYDEENSEFVDGANRALAIYLDSRLNRHFLRSGGRYATPINLDRDVFLINLNTTQGATLIYAFRDKISRPWFAALNPTNWRAGGMSEYVFSDMNGHAIDNKYIGEIKSATWWQKGITFLSPLFMIASATSNGWSIHVVEILDRTTLRELKTLMSHATIHPWPTLVCGESGKDVVTQDGHVIRVNPRTRQLTDSYGWALFNSHSGLPIVFHNNDIITTNFQQQKIENAVLLDSLTVWELLNSGTDFRMGFVTTAFGSFDVPILLANPNGDPNNPDWRLMNGQSANGVIDELLPTEVLDGESFGEWFGRVFGGGSGNGFSFMQILQIIVLLAVLLILLRIFLPMFMNLLDSRRNKPRKQNYNNYYKRSYKSQRKKRRSQ